MKFGKLIKRLYLSVILLLSVVTLLPLLFISLDIGVYGYKQSFLYKIISELED